MSKKKNPQDWTDVYPQGTKEGDEEQELFIALARHKKWAWRSVAQLAKETSLTRERIEEILNKYNKRGMVFQSPSNADNWGYWERVPEMLEEKPTLTEKDQDDRIEKNVQP